MRERQLALSHLSLYLPPESNCFLTQQVGAMADGGDGRGMGKGGEDV